MFILLLVSSKSNHVVNAINTNFALALFLLHSVPIKLMVFCKASANAKLEVNV
jgi:hypothetical protein